MRQIFQTRPVAGFPGYHVSDDGFVYGPGRWTGNGAIEPLKPAVDRRGYLKVVLVGPDGFKATERAHRLVALAFLGDPPEGKNQVRHLDGNPANNSVRNLAWGDQSDNEQDKRRHGTPSYTRGERHGRSKLTESQVREIRGRQGVSTYKLAKDYAVGETTIRKIITRENWGWLPDSEAA